MRAALIAAITLVLVNVVAARLTTNSNPRQLIRTIETAAPSVDVLGVGNSLIAAGFDAPAIEETFQAAGQPVRALNAGLGATGVIEHLALTRLALRGRSVRWLVYGYFDHQLRLDVVQHVSELIGNRSMLFYLEPELTLQYAAFGPADRLSFQVFRRVPLLRERSTRWARVERVRREAGSVGLPPAAVNQFGRAGDFAQLEAASPGQFDERNRQALASKDSLSPPVRALLREARDHGVHVVVVAMPMHPQHVERFYGLPSWTSFKDATRNAVEAEGAAYVDASTWIPDAASFDDHLHLSRAGARTFSTQLASRLRLDLRTPASPAVSLPPAPPTGRPDSSR